MTANPSGVGKLGALMLNIQTRQQEFRKRIRQRLKNPGGSTTPVFLVGNVRSGTSMIVYQLARSWQVSLYNEDNPTAFRLWRLREFSVIDQILEKSHAPVTLFKPILDTYRTLVLLDKYPNAKVLFAFRHFNDVINSTRKRFYNRAGLYRPSKKVPDHDTRDPVTAWVTDDFADFSDAPLPEKTTSMIREKWSPNLNLDSNIALRWLMFNRLYFDLRLFENERVKLVHYESVVEDPEIEFRKIFTFLGLAFESAVTEGIFSSSVGKNNAPSIEPEIYKECLSLYDRLYLHFRNNQDSQACDASGPQRVP